MGRWTSIVAVRLPLKLGGSTTVLQSIWRSMDGESSLVRYGDVEVISSSDRSCNATLCCAHRWWICFQPRFFTWFDHQSWYPLGRPVATSLGEVFSYLFIHLAQHISLVALFSLSKALIRTWLNTKEYQFSFNNRSNKHLIQPIVYNKYSTLCYQDHLSWHADHGCAPMANPAKLWQLLGFEQCLLLYACVVPWQTLGH